MALHERVQRRLLEVPIRHADGSSGTDLWDIGTTTRTEQLHDGSILVHRTDGPPLHIDLTVAAERLRLVQQYEPETTEERIRRVTAATCLAAGKPPPPRASEIGPGR